MCLTERFLCTTFEAFSIKSVHTELVYMYIILYIIEKSSCEHTRCIWFVLLALNSYVDDLLTTYIIYGSMALTYSPS